VVRCRIPHPPHRSQATHESNSLKNHARNPTATPIRPRPRATLSAGHPDGLNNVFNKQLALYVQNSKNREHNKIKNVHNFAQRQPVTPESVPRWPGCPANPVFLWLSFPRSRSYSVKLQGNRPAFSSGVRTNGSRPPIPARQDNSSGHRPTRGMLGRYA
jgi:hypothetical protein